MIALALALCFLGTLTRARPTGPDVVAGGVAGAHRRRPSGRRGLRGVRRGRHLADPPTGAQPDPGDRDRRAVGVLLTAFWLVPLGGEPRLHDRHALRADRQLPRLDVPVRELVPVYPLAAIAIFTGIWFDGHAGTLDIATLTVATGLVFYNWEGLRSILGKAPAWNLQLLPFWYLMLFLLPGLGVAELVRLTHTGRHVGVVLRGPDAGPRARTVRAPRPTTHSPTTRRTPRRRRSRARTGAAHGGMSRNSIRVLAIRHPRGRRHHRRAGARAANRDFLPYWTRYNYTGYESGSTSDFRRQIVWPEYRSPSSTPRTRCRRGGWRGRAATPSALRHPAGARAAARTGRTAASSRWRACTSRRRRPRRTTS